MQSHKIEIAFHRAGTTKNLDLMLSLFINDETITSEGKTYKGRNRSEDIGRRLGRFNHSIIGSLISRHSASNTMSKVIARTSTLNVSMSIKSRTRLSHTRIQTI